MYNVSYIIHVCKILLTKGNYLVTFVRLFDQFKPKNYNIKLNLDKHKMKFSGNSVVVGTIAKKSHKLSLHSKDLYIKSVKINGLLAGHSQLPNDELLIELDKAIVGEISIDIRFVGKITKPMHGLYPCFTKSDDVILATQFESHHAREVFPCIDEPEAKATFDLTLTTDKDEVVLSNMPALQQYTENDLLTTVFEQTPLMSTYLLAFVVGDMQSVSGQTANGTQVNIWSSKDHQKNQLDFALKTTIKTIEFFNKYYKTVYPLPKCDQVALPDFSSGAMENWGLITYREVCLLVDPKKTSTTTKEYVALVVAHELSHQWFGNLVTMEWWNDLWLNESFANLMEYIAVNAIYPEWDIMLSYAAGEALSASRRDMIPGVQAVSTNVDHPDQISTLFDPSIVYAKGSRLLFMAYNLIGDKDFRDGLRIYFKKHAYQNTVGNDLWQALSETSGIDIGRVMNSWINKPGFPLLTVEQSENELVLSQSKFNDSTSTDLWPIPLFANQNIDLDILDTKQKKLVVTDKNILFNTLGGHYGVHYKDPAKLEYLRDQILDNRLTESQKLLLLNDLCLQAKIGVCSITDVIGLLRAFENETSEPVWSVISIVIAEARRIVESDDTANDQLKTFVFSLVQEQLMRLGWVKNENETSNDTKLREIILGLAAFSENGDFIKEAQKRFKAQKFVNLPADTRHILISVAVKFGDEKLYDDLVATYPLQTNSELQQDIAGGLTSTKDSKLAKKVLGKLKDSSWVRLQDFDRLLVQLLMNKHTRKVAWRWLTSNWGWIEKSFASDKSYDNLPRYSAGAFATDEWLKEYKAFFGPKKKIPALTRNIVMGEADIKAKIKWTKRDHKKLVKWLKTSSI